MKLQFLGTGTSHGVPVIACDCPVCKSTDFHDKRFRSSVYITADDGKCILIDVGPDFRMQALNFNIRKIDAVLLTHAHADHLHGIDDLRIFSCEVSNNSDNKNDKYNAPPIPIYTNSETAKDISFRFDYLFKEVTEGGGHAKILVKSVSNKFKIGETTITPLPMMHGHLPTTGWLVTTKENNSIAYLTDCNYISDDSIALIHKNCGKLKHLVIDGLRIKKHSTHFNYLDALQASSKIGGENIWLTHMAHNSSHEETAAYLDEHRKDFPELENADTILPAYDGLIIQC